MDDRIVAIITSVFGAFVGIAGLGFGVINRIIAPLTERVNSLQQNLKETEERSRAELDKSERGLKELTERAEKIVRQTVDDVVKKLRREAELIEEKTAIKFADMQRQIELLRTE